MIPILGEKNWTPQMKLKDSQVKGPRGQTAGSYVMDRADLKKALTLCPGCVQKFDIKGAGYTTKKNLPFVRGRCDGCQTYVDRGHLLVHQSLANLC